MKPIFQFSSLKFARYKVTFLSLIYIFKDWSLVISSAWCGISSKISRCYFPKEINRTLGDAATGYLNRAPLLLRAWARERPYVFSHWHGPRRLWVPQSKPFEVIGKLIDIPEPLFPHL